MQRRLFAAALAITIMGTAACGGTGGSSDAASPQATRTIPPGGIPHPLGADDVVLQVADTGGLVPDAVRIGEWPGYSIYGDGLLIQPGPQIEIYPPPAQPAMVSQTITEEGVQAILEGAGEAGLTDGDHTYSHADVFDASTTVFTVNADDRTSVTAVYALGIPGGANAHTPPAEQAAREKIDEFAIKLRALGTWLPDGSLGVERQYTPAGLIVFASPYTEPEDPNLTQADRPWPLDTPLADLGTSLPESDIQCGVITGEDFRTLWNDIASANQLTPWTSDGQRYSVIFRPKLPNETTCPTR